MAIPLKSLRESKNMTQLELSKILRVSPSAVAMYERGQRSPDYQKRAVKAPCFSCGDETAQFL